MKICYFYDGEYPWDVRVEKICNSLLKKDIEVYILSRNKFQKEGFECYKGIKIIRIPFVKNKLINNVINTSVFINPIWFIQLYQLVKKEGIDLIIIRDLPISLAGILVSKVLKKNCIFDMAEPYPESLRDMWRYDRAMKLGDIFIRNPHLADVIERFSIEFSNHILVVSQESKNRLINFRTPKEKITVIGNTPNMDRFHPMHPTYPGTLARMKENKILIFIGNLFEDRGLILAVKAMKRITKEFPIARLLIIGDGPERKYIEKEIKSLNLTKQIILEGWIKHNKLPEYIASSHIGILPFLPSGHMNVTLANKLFDYMAMGKPVITSDVLAMKRILCEEKNGLTFKAGDEQSLAHAVVTMLSSPRMEKYMGNNGLKAVQNKYNWQNEEKKLYKSLDKFK